jgi:hypothetical protein
MVLRKRGLAVWCESHCSLRRSLQVPSAWARRSPQLCCCFRRMISGLLERLQHEFLNYGEELRLFEFLWMVDFYSSPFSSFIKLLIYIRMDSWIFISYFRLSSIFISAPGSSCIFLVQARDSTISARILLIPNKLVCSLFLGFCCYQAVRADRTRNYTCVH